MTTISNIKQDKMKNMDNGFEALFGGTDIKTVEHEIPINRTKEGPLKTEIIITTIESEKKASKPKKEVEPEQSIKEVRRTFEVDREIYQKITIMAHWELTSIKEIINNVLKQTVVQYEKTHGPLVKVPKSKTKA